MKIIGKIHEESAKRTRVQRETEVTCRYVGEASAVGRRSKAAGGVGVPSLSVLSTQ